MFTDVSTFLCPWDARVFLEASQNTRIGKSLRNVPGPLSGAAKVVEGL
jgi:hypothetical protein